MDDPISRQAAIDALRYAQHRFTVADEAGGMGTVKWSEDVIYFAAAEKVLTELPAAQPERKTGTWVGYDDDWLKTMCKCSECGAMIDVNEKYRNFFCYHCGVKMEVKK